MKEDKLLLRYNLQFFAKDGPGGEKTEEPTAKKLADTRKEGQVAKSQDLGSAISLIIMFILLRLYIGTMGTQFLELFSSSYAKIGDLADPVSGEITLSAVVSMFQDSLLSILLLEAPFFVVAFLVGFIVNLVQVKWKVTTKPLQPKLSKMNPIKGFKKIFSVQSLINLLKSVALVLIISYLVWNVVQDNKDIIYTFYDMSLFDALDSIKTIVLNVGLKISLIYLIVGVGDYIFQKHKFKEDVKMTKQEVKDEYKNSEGDPQIKGKIRQKMQQASMRRMMQSLPEADVVITNPTHFAVAIKYDTTVAKAPVVLAKGQDFLAQKIKESARENQIEIVENKPLARMLYFNVEIGEEIPQELYQMVAEVLAYVYSLKEGQAVRS